ncbi:TetR/AcrR family transcriptional regulator [soil metagenome]
MATVETRGRGRPSEGARDALLDAARELFIERDFENVPTEEILERAGVSRGAMYHHFSGKRDLYREVWRESERRLIVRLGAAAGSASTPYEALSAGCLAYLDEAGDNPELRRIGLLQSRTVMGWEGWREGISDLGLATMRAGIEAAMESGELKRSDPEATAHILMAALIEAALLIATADDAAAARADAEPPIRALLSGLRR